MWWYSGIVVAATILSCSLVRAALACTHAVNTYNVIIAKHGQQPASNFTERAITIGAIAVAACLDVNILRNMNRVRGDPGLIGIVGLNHASL